MKNLFKTLIAVAIVSVTVQSCKKGEDDPALSLRSRDARLIGEWKLTKYDSKRDVRDASTNTTVNGISRTQTLSITEAFDGSVQTTTVSYQDVSSPGGTDSENTTYRENYTMEMEILKDGTCKITTTNNPVSVTTVRVPAQPRPSFAIASPGVGGGAGYTWTNSDYDETYNYASSTNKDETTGYWHWLSSNKNKTTVLIDGLGMFNVRQLKNKEIVLELISDDTNSATGAGYTGDGFDKITSTWTFEAK
jgi:hypothetical protein